MNKYKLNIKLGYCCLRKCYEDISWWDIENDVGYCNKHAEKSIKVKPNLRHIKTKESYSKDKSK